MSRPVNFYFEFGSPYSYLASLEIDARAAAQGVEVDWKPVDIFHIWKSQGLQDAYAQVRTAKIPYIQRDAGRCARQAGVRLNPPPGLGTDTRIAKLAYYGMRAAGDARARPFVKQVWNSYFLEAMPLGSAKEVAAAAGPLGLGAADIEALVQGNAAALLFAEANQEAIAAQCFGIPWMEYDGEHFFGHDRIEHLAGTLARKAAKAGAVAGA